MKNHNTYQTAGSIVIIKICSTTINPGELQNYTVCQHAVIMSAQLNGKQKNFIEYTPLPVLVRINAAL